MKKVIFMLAAVVALFMATTACAKKNAPAKKNNKKVLVAYFSATGTTEGAAKMIAKATGGELYKIQPKQEYTSADLDWTVKTSRCSRENDNPKARPAFVKTKASLDKYDVVYLGYPCWWNAAPRIINSFIEAYALKGKTVIPFMTSGGSQIDNSERLLKELYPTIAWKEGRLLNGATQKDVDEWVKGM